MPITKSPQPNGRDKSAMAQKAISASGLARMSGHGSRLAGDEPRSSLRTASSGTNAEELRRKARTVARQQQAAERLATAATQLSANVTEAAAAAEELASSMQQIAEGAEQSAAASEESMTAMRQIDTSVSAQAAAAARSQTRAEDLQRTIDQTARGIREMVSGVSSAAERQVASVQMMIELDQQATNIIDSVTQVIRIADQTNLLALNAAIEAARAGSHGKGFAVVADTVRTLAEASEKNASTIQGLVAEIRDGIKAITETVSGSAQSARGEVEKSAKVVESLAEIMRQIGAIVEANQAVDRAATEMSAATRQALKASEEIAAAAEEQSAAATETIKGVNSQSQALQTADVAASELVGLADDLRTSTDIAKSSEEVAASAESLSATIEELSASSEQVQKAINQIESVAASQAAAAEESVAGITQIDRSSTDAVDRLKAVMGLTETISDRLAENKVVVDEVIVGISTANEAGQKSARDIQNLELLSRRIDKIVDAISNVAIQTSMLAVNGAVEAARAGEYGKGFAVVSSDIQHLANDAAENAETIKDLVKAIQDQIGVVRADMLQIAQNALADVERAKISTSALVAVEGGMKDMLADTQGMLAGAQEIGVATVQAKKGAEQIAAAAEQASTGARQGATAAEQQKAGIAQLAQAVEAIASTADELQSGI